MEQRVEELKLYTEANILVKCNDYTDMLKLMTYNIEVMDEIGRKYTEASRKVDNLAKNIKIQASIHKDIHALMNTLKSQIEKQSNPNDYYSYE